MAQVQDMLALLRAAKEKEKEIGGDLPVYEVPMRLFIGVEDPDDVKAVVYAVMRYVVEDMDLAEALPEVEGDLVISMGGQPHMAKLRGETWSERRQRLHEANT